MRKKVLLARLKQYENALIEKTEQNSQLQKDKAGLIKYVKKQRETIRFKTNETMRLSNNLNALLMTYQENDTALQKALEANALLAGKVNAYEKCLNNTTNSD